MMNEWIVSSSLLICAVLLGRRLLRGKISLRLQYALWLAVLIRLLLPVQIFTSSIGAGSMAQTVDISQPVRQVYHSAREDDYERAYDAAYSQVVAEYLAASQSYDPVIVEREAAEQASATMELDFNKLLYGVWFGGMLVMTSVIAACNLHLGLYLKRSRREYPVHDSLLSVYVTEAVPTPCIFGLFRPAIYLTPEAAGEDSVRSHVLAHELTHYRHLDHIWSVLRSLCLILHWYNPLVWIAAKVSRADAELACDEGALARLGEEHRADYGRTLIGLTCPDNGSSMFVTATTMTGSAGSIRERIKLLMKRPRNTVLALIAVVLVGTIVVGCSFAGAPETTEPTETTVPGVDNDMSYQGQELPIPEIQADIYNDEGVLVYPGVEWFMTEEEVMAALGVSREECWDWERTSAEGMTANSFTVRHADAFGVPMELCFTFRSFWDDVEPVLTEVYGDFDDGEDFETVRGLYAYALGETDVQMTPGIEERWDGDVTFRELLGKEGYDILEHCAGNSMLDRPASFVQWVDSGSEEIIWFTELPIADASEHIDYFNDLLNPDLYRSEADWYPRALTSYYDSPAGIDLFQFFYNGIPGADNTLPPDELAFLEDQPGYEPDFDLVRIPAREMDRVLAKYFGFTLDETARIGLANFIYNPQSGCYYHCHTDTNLSFRTVYSVEELTEMFWRVRYTSDIGDGEVILRQLDGKWQIASHLPVEITSSEPTDPAADALASFTEPANCEALTRLWNGWTGFSENEFVPAFTPEILDIVQSVEDAIMVYYRRPGEQQLYAAELMPHEDGWAVTGNSLVISKPDGARDLTAEEIRQVSAAFAPSIIDEELGEGIANPLACIVNDYYDDVTKLDRSELLAYFPGGSGASEREFKLLKEKYPDFFGGWTWEDMPIPIHGYDPKTINAVLNRYADIRWEDLQRDEGLHYLEETGCFYNYTSDFGLLGFHCTGGWVTDKGAVLLSNHSALYMTERNGDYFITAHLPAMTMPTHSSNPMIPADLSDEDAVKTVTEAFLTAYGENIYLNRDNKYDHLTVLATEEDAAAFYGNGQSVPMLDFRENIQDVHKMEDYWKQARQEQGITRSNFKAECLFESITFDGDIATVTVGCAMSFTYDDQPGTTSGMRDDYKLVLVRVDGEWLIAEVSEIGA